MTYSRSMFLVSAFAVVALFGGSTVLAKETGPLEPVGRERVATGLYSSGLAIHGEDLLFTTVTHMAHGHGQGHNLMIWRRPLDGELWRTLPVRPERKPAMLSVVPLEHRPGETLLAYVDRQDEDDRVVYLERLIDDNELVSILDYSEDRGVLNPLVAPVPEDDAAYLFIPDRGADWRVRWFRIGLDDDSVERLEDIPMPVRGARLFGHHRDGDRLVLPVGLAQELHVLDIDLDTGTYELIQVDTADSPDQQPCRSVSVHPFPEQNLYLLTYLRPAEFSDRPRTGLVGEVVANALCMDSLESIERTVIGGYRAEEAATHQIASAKVAEDAFVTAYTTVDRVHQRHLTAEFVNYVSSHVDRWRLESDGSVTAQTQHEMDPFWRVNLAMDEQDGMLYMLAADTIDVFPVWLKQWRVR